MRASHAVAGLIAVVSIACSAKSGPPLGTSSSRIIGGTAATGDPAVVVFQATGDEGGDCTAEFISTTVLLTAAHCLLTEDNKPMKGATFRIFRGNDVSKAKDADWIPIDASDVHPHPSYDGEDHDIAVLVLKQAVDVTPLAFSRKALSSSDVGKAVRLIGYGASIAGAPEDSDGFGIKRQLDTTIGKVQTGFIEVGKKGKTACSGDSGGPALVTIDGVETIIAVDSFSDAEEDCTGSEFYQRVDTELAFITPFLTATPPAETAGTPGDDDEEDADDKPAGADKPSKSTTAKDDDGEPTASTGGCAIGHGAGASGWPLALALAVVLRRRRRPRVSPGA